MRQKYTKISSGGVGRIEFAPLGLGENGGKRIGTIPSRVVLGPSEVNRDLDYAWQLSREPAQSRWPLQYRHA